jgi:hypothetical protein
MIDWRQLQRELPGILNDIHGTLEQAVEIVATLAENDPTRIPVPAIRIVFTDNRGETVWITLRFEVPGSVELSATEMIEYRSGDTIQPPTSYRPATKCLLCDYTGPDLDALGLCANCLPRPA